MLNHQIVFPSKLNVHMQYLLVLKRAKSKLHFVFFFNSLHYTIPYNQLLKIRKSITIVADPSNLDSNSKLKVIKGHTNLVELIS